MTYPHPIIAREGWPFVALALAVALALSALRLAVAARGARVARRRVHRAVLPRSAARGSAAAECGALAGRRPDRDGRARRAIPYLDRDALKISVFMNVFNVHSNRSPGGRHRRRTSGITRGSFVNAALDKASLENERNALHLRTAGGRDVTCVQIAGLDRAAHPLLREARRHARARPALRLHPLRLARRRLPAADGGAEGRRRRHGVRDRDDPRRAAAA